MLCRLSTRNRYDQVCSTALSFDPANTDLVVTVVTGSNRLIDPDSVWYSPFYQNSPLFCYHRTQKMVFLPKQRERYAWSNTEFLCLALPGLIHLSTTVRNNKKYCPDIFVIWHFCCWKKYFCVAINAGIMTIIGDWVWLLDIGLLSLPVVQFKKKKDF